ncbi:hypothetical protein QJ856_gp0015 [Tupanvirus deep ocean]|uniref:Uncharacterized protein n=2 Tax=Tupanvirus TaxID=2094720 RepID=A0AC62A6Y8_9VIRU|nr:hypothetical protein QJ856_gp0015 [Tupanvirus deep ocean]QKU33433.1 hypothetical protein [Tupanvirus deep ocean]
MIRVGRCKYIGGQRIDPTYPGFTPILVLMKGHSEWGDLGPYTLKDDQGRIMENVWQFSKCYKKVPQTTQFYSRWNKKITWSYPEEVHYANGELLPAYWTWREKGMNNAYYVRYPVGFGNMHTCLFAIKESEPNKRLNYIEGRKEIYVPVYCELGKKEPKFAELKNRLINGENLLIIEVDGPHQESLNYYKDMYDVDNDFIENNTMLASEENLTIMLNDDKHPFGHGYCLAMALQDLENLTQLF